MERVTVLQVAPELPGIRRLACSGGRLCLGGRGGRGEDGQRVDTQRKADGEDTRMGCQKQQGFLHGRKSRGVLMTMCVEYGPPLCDTMLWCCR